MNFRTMARQHRVKTEKNQVHINLAIFNGIFFLFHAITCLPDKNNHFVHSKELHNHITNFITDMYTW